MDTRFKHPFTAVIAGPTSSGKTEFIKKLLRNIEDMITPTPHNILFCYGEWQPAYEDMKKYGLDIAFMEGLVHFDDLKPGPPKLIIIDDLMGETNDQITRLFTKGSHHKNVSVIHILQNLFSKNKEQRCINLNTQYIVLFKNPRDASQIIHLAKQMYPKNVRFMQEAYKMATTNPFSYLLIDLKQDTPEHLRLRSDIFHSDARQTVYMPRQ